METENKMAGKGIQQGPKAPKDPTKKRKGFYIMRNKEISGLPMPDQKGVQHIYLDGDRLTTFARMVGNLTDEEEIGMLKTVEGMRKLVHSIGVSVELTEGNTKKIDFLFQMYGKRDPYGSGTLIKAEIPTDGMEQVINFAECAWSDDDNVPGQMLFTFPVPGELAKASVKFYLNDGFDAPEEEPEDEPDLDSTFYKEMLEKSLMQTGNTARLKRAINKARNGEDVTVAFIGGSITQGAGAIPINTECYAYKTFERFCDLTGRGKEDNVHYIKAGVGGTPSELGMLRYEADVLRHGKVQPDVVIVEFAVNDAGDETEGECYDSLVRKILKADNAPAVILLFAVFASDWNLQDRLHVVGKAYDLPMVSVKDAVVEQFYKKSGEGKVFNKNQFFYDVFHPSNLGHTVMADCIGHLLRAVDQSPEEEDNLKLDQIKAPKGDEFEDVTLYDRSCERSDIHVECGCFDKQDEDLQAVEMDLNLAPTKEFQNNWMKAAGSKMDAPFAMDITCSALLLIYKDSGSMDFGKAEVWVDGEKVLTADPHLNGWTHCNPLICFRGRECRQYHVEVKMAPGDEEKAFTILGFGVVIA